MPLKLVLQTLIIWRILF